MAGRDRLLAKEETDMSYADIIALTLKPTATPAWNTPAANVAVRVFNIKAASNWAAQYSKAHGAGA